MRNLNFGSPVSDKPEDHIRWLMHCMRLIQTEIRATDALSISDGFTVANVTTTRSLDVSAVTLTGLANAFGTYLQDCKKRGPKQAGG